MSNRSVYGFHIHACCAALLVFAASALATPRINTETVEWSTADADLIVRGKITSIEDDPGGRGAILCWKRLKVDVLETLKGPGLSQLLIAHCSRTSLEVHEEKRWNDPSGEVVLFLDRAERFGNGRGLPEGCKWLLRRYGGPYCFGGEQILWLNQKEAPRMRSMTNFIRDHDGFSERTDIDVHEALQRVREIVSNAAANTRPREMVMAYWGVDWWDNWDDYGGVIVPLGEPFSAVMRQHATRPAWRRWCLHYLAHDRSPMNEEFFRNMLSDSQYATRASTEMTAPWQENHYAGRDEAYRILRHWGVAADRPVIDAPADWHEPVGRTLAGVALILLAWPAAWVSVKRRDGRPCSFAAMLTVFWLIFFIAACTAWLASYRWAWSLAWPYASEGRWQLASYHGAVRLLRVDREPTARPLGMMGAIFHPIGNETNDWDLRNIASQIPRTSIGGGECGRVQLHPSTPEFGWIGLIPWWWVAGITSAPLLALAVGPLRQSQRRRKRYKCGLCVHCGYDLRASSDRCPECGQQT